MQSKGLPWTYIIPVIILIGIIGGLILYNTIVATTTVSALAPISIPASTVQSLPDVPYYCDGQPGCTTIYHWHVHLDIYVDNTSYVLLPLDLGHIGTVNLFAIHAHDSSGVVHLECCNPSQNQSFTLGEVFEVWGYPTFDSTHCLTYSGQNVSVYVNGVRWTSSPIASIRLSNHMEIAVVIGNVHPPIPSSYTFPAGL